MTYSRSRTNSQKKSKRRSKTRFLLIVNGILLCCILLVVFFVWKSNQEETTAPGKLHPQSVETPTGELPSTKPPEQTDIAEPEQTPEEGNAEPEINNNKVTLALVGDILPAASVLTLMEKNGFDYPFREAKSLLVAADITAGNLEAPITKRGTPAKNKQYVFRGSADAIPALKEAGFDFLSLANNHTLDYGWEGLSDTMDVLDDAGLKHAGSGIDDREAFTPAYIERNGITVGFVSVTGVVPEVSWKADRNHPGVAETYSPDRAVAAIKVAKENADIVVVMVHWGKERVDRPIATQTDLAHRYIDGGADLVIGGHPHVLQGFEYYKGKWIAYSLGNFVFSTTGTITSETGVLNAECDKGGTCSLKFNPMFATSSQPAPMKEVEGKALLARLSKLSYGASVEEDGTIVARN
ncbi:CapA family protein [Cohnella abietis]|uniref:Capsular polysaccharide biosynthesis protein n=1 Tax=Cohnella abietis TaxID=2507935 RepID=A0A3T1D9V4_9BACL|nr:CapA family protein [Cohnella abietis]BBI34845.1 capsular polysaccharide biosynthesis protein [Cohnella abietis]